MGCFCHYRPCEEALAALTEEDVQCGTKKKEMDEKWRQYIEEKCYTFVEMWECEQWKLYQTDKPVKEHFRGSFP